MANSIWGGEDRPTYYSHPSAFLDGPDPSVLRIFGTGTRDALSGGDTLADQTPEQIVKEWMAGFIRNQLSQSGGGAILLDADVAQAATGHFVGFEWADQVQTNAVAWAADVIAAYQQERIAAAHSRESILADPLSTGRRSAFNLP